jgi:hypothetical protein
MDVVDLHSGCGGLMGLVKPLQYGGQQPLGSADQSGRSSNVVGLDAADFGGSLRRVLRDALAQLVESDGVSVDVALIDPVMADDFM